MNLNKVFSQMIYSYPPIDCARDTDTGKELCITLYGNTNSTWIALKSVYNQCQYAYIQNDTICFVKLTINVCTEQGEELAHKVESDMPGIAMYPEYATIRCFDKNSGSDVKADYKVECTLNGYTVFLPDGMIYSDFDETAAKELDFVNINQKYVNMLARESCASFSEAIEKRNQQERDDRYNFDSSYAASAHMPARLYLFGKNRDEAKYELNQLLIKSDEDKQKDLRYKALTVLEHRRWNAYMISDGFQAPSVDVFMENAYKKWKDHKDKSKKLHPCICDMGQDPFYLSNHPDAWNEDDFENDPNLSELDKLSVRTYRLCKERAAEIKEEVDSKIRSLEEKNSLLGTFCDICNKVILDENCNEGYLYKTCKKDALTIDNGKYETLIKEIDDSLEVFRVRNRKKDYALLDVNIIDALSFDLWHGMNYRKAIISCSGNTVEDIKIPFLLSCSESYFLLDKNANDKEDQQDKISRFFEMRSLGEPIFKEADFSDMESFNSYLRELIKSFDLNDKEEVVLGCTNLIPGCAAFSYGHLLNEFNNIRLFIAHNSDVYDCVTGDKISCGIERDITSIEFLQLAAAEYENLYEIQPTFEEFSKLSDIFRRYSTIKKYDETKSSIWSVFNEDFGKACKPYELNEDDLISFFGKEIYDAAVMEDSDNNGESTKRLYNVSFDPQLYDKLNVGKLVKNLCDYRIIGDLSGNPFGEGISAEAPDYWIRITLLCISKLTSLDVSTPREIVFQRPMKRRNSIKHAISLRDNKIRSFRLYSSKDKDDIKSGKTRMISDMIKEGIIKNLDNMELMTEGVIDSAEEKVLSFDFSDVYFKQLFQMMGKCFEIILFRKIQDLGMFSDSKNGVIIAWDNSGNWDSFGRIQGYFNDHTGVGENFYFKAKEKSKTVDTCMIENEIDIVLMNNMNPIFISCKTGTTIKNEWLYEIAAVADHFKAVPVLAVGFDLLGKISDDIPGDDLNIKIMRAKGMGISLIGNETIFDNDKLKEAMNCIRKGKTFCVINDTVE